MAISHFSVRIVSRGSGRSAVIAAAYRHRTKMEFEREARTIDYSEKPDLLHEEFLIPADAPDWVRAIVAERPVASASEAFWNKVEAFEKRPDAALAKDATIALPVELSREQNIALVRDFISQHVTAKGMVADWVYHDAPGNPHVHLMTTLRPLTTDGFGAKMVPVLGADGLQLRTDAGRGFYKRWAGDIDAFFAFRNGWFDCQNQHLAAAGLDIHVDGRSFERQGIELQPTLHVGVKTTAIERNAAGLTSELYERLVLQTKRRTDNARRIQRNPDLVLELITREKSVFDARDVAKILHRYVDDASLFHNLMVRILQSPQTLRLDRERVDFATGERMPAKYTTRDLIRLEAEMANRAIWLSQRSSNGIRNAVLQATLARHSHLSEEQKTAIVHVTGPERIAAVIGRAGTGKTTMMKAAREVWEAAGYRVVGGALAGKAAEGLEKEAGITSRTLSSWELGWSRGRYHLDDKTVFVLDEAGMVSSRQMVHFVEAATTTGAKLVLIGDPEQLQPIEAGAAFRAIIDRIGYAELETIYRQQQQWMRDASLDLARGKIDAAVDAYQVNGKVLGSELKAEAVSNLIADWDRDYDPGKTSLILAHLRRDVRLLNELARARLVERGIVEDGFVFRTGDGDRKFAAGDQIVFLRNEGSIGVKNGMIGRIVEAGPACFVAEIGNGAHRRQVPVTQRFYNNVDHGYATTIHRSQGASVDRVKLLASLSLDRHLTYVAMTRHREDLAVYYGSRSFAKAGGLVELLCRKNSKETTLDYDKGAFYRAALHFAEVRGLHLINVARTLVHDRLEWTVRQVARLADLSARLAAFAGRLGLTTAVKSRSINIAAKEILPMVSGIDIFPKTIEQAVEDTLAADPGLKKQWEEVSQRFHRVYAQPQASFRAVNIDAMLMDDRVAQSTIATIASAPHTFGALKGKTGLLSGKADRLDRERALKNVGPLADSLSDYLRQRVEAEQRAVAEETSVRRQASINIPAISENAKTVLEKVRDAIDRNDLPAGLEFALADRQVKAELEGFASAVSERFGERTLLSLAAKSADGEVFRHVTSGMTPAQKLEVQGAWNAMRTIQQLSAHERTVTAVTLAESIRQTKSQGLSLK